MSGFKKKGMWERSYLVKDLRRKFIKVNEWCDRFNRLKNVLIDKNERLLLLTFIIIIIFILLTLLYLYYCYNYFFINFINILIIYFIILLLLFYLLYSIWF